MEIFWFSIVKIDLSSLNVFVYSIGSDLAISIQRKSRHLMLANLCGRYLDVVIKCLSEGYNSIISDGILIIVTRQSLCYCDLE